MEKKNVFTIIFSQEGLLYTLESDLVLVTAVPLLSASVLYFSAL